MGANGILAVDVVYSNQFNKSGFMEEENMWICPKCGRQFKRTNQGHYCGKAPETVSEYIDLQPSETHSHLKELMTAIRDNVPYVHECILWSMPYYKKGEKSISFAAFKKHVSFYVGAEVIEEFSSELNEFVTKKDAIYLPYSKEFPTQVIIDIAKRCLN